MARPTPDIICNKEGQQFYTVQGAANYLGRSTKMVRNYIKQGKILAYAMLIDGYRVLRMSDVHQMKECPAKIYGAEK